LLYQIKRYFLVFIAIFFTGCGVPDISNVQSAISTTLTSVVDFSNGNSEETYTYDDYQSGVYKTSPKSGNIKDSKAMHRATMRAYQIRGKWYYPTTTSLGQKYDGIASWYGPKFHGKKTSNGEMYDMYAHTAAHKTLPMNTMLKVVNKDNGKTTIVRVNDRGPFVDDRIIDLSNVAAHDIDMVKKGTAPVTIEVIGFSGKVASLVAGSSTSDNYETTVASSNFSIQIGAFKNLDGAKEYQSKYKLVDGRYRAIIKEFEMNNEPIYKIWLTGFQSIEEAKDFRDSSEFKGAFIIGD
jgi:rare lipoprotein A